MRKTKYLITTLAVLAVLPAAAQRFPSSGSDNSRDRETSRSRDRDRISYSTNASTRTSSSRQTSSTDFGNVQRASRLIGTSVETSDGERAGQIKDMVADLESGRVLYAVVSTSRLPGVGSEIAVPPGVFQSARGERATLSVDRKALNDAPKFTSDVDKPDQLGKASFVHQVHQHFNQSAWWQGANAPDAGKFNNVHKLSKISGMKVKNVTDQPVGEVNNVMVDLPAGRVALVVLAPAEELNLSGKLFALPPDALTLSSDQKMLVSDVTREKLASAPSFNRDDWGKVSDRTFASSVYRHYGKQAYFESGTGLAPTGREDERRYDRDYDRRNRTWDRDRSLDRDRRDSDRRSDIDREHDQWHDSYEAEHDRYHRDVEKDRD